ncbi:MAG TPA: quinol:electron acceptor oxidoreductase subunit ActD [Magnetospirillaceae bacterium]|nr:quinol:electron acceptor oxidoreductase subunit ActD [Magnetospirillaceae bacterium]
MSLAGRFVNEQALAAAAARLREAGIEPLEIITPHPVEQLERGISPVPVIVLLAGIGAFVASLGLQIYAASRSYPIDIGGRPYNSWLAFIPTAFENGILLAVVAGFLSFLVLSWRRSPITEAPGEGYWLAVAPEARAELEATRPSSIAELAP